MFTDRRNGVALVVMLACCLVMLGFLAAQVEAAGRQESPVWHGSRPGDGSATVTPNDSTNLTQIARSVFIETGGTIKFTALDGTVDTWTVPDSFYLNVQVARVWSTGTTATGIHAIY